jgi:hypothetical protein
MAGASRRGGPQTTVALGDPKVQMGWDSQRGVSRELDSRHRIMQFNRRQPVCDSPGPANFITHD